MSKNDTLGDTEDTSVSAIDKAIAAAKARKAMKQGDPRNTPSTPMAPNRPKAAKVAKEPKEPKQPKVSEAEKAAKKEARDAERAAKKLVRDEARAVKKAEREANRKPAHLSKVERARAKLPAMSTLAELVFNEATASLTAADVATLCAHLAFFNRAQATERALEAKPNEGDIVKVIGGDPRYIGKVGTVTKAQRIRMYVDIEGFNKPCYMFTSDAEVIEHASVEATTETVAEEPAQATG